MLCHVHDWRTSFLEVYFRKSKMLRKNPSVSGYGCLCQKSAKTHLRASGTSKNFPGGSAPWTPREGEGKGRGRGGKGGEGGKGGGKAHDASRTMCLVGRGESYIKLEHLNLKLSRKLIQLQTFIAQIILVPELKNTPKFTKMPLWLGLRPRPRLGSSRRSPRPVSTGQKKF